MFTGIVEEMGIIREKGNDFLVIHAKEILEDLKQGDSIAVNGICLTITEFTENDFKTNLMPETLKLTNLSTLSIGDKVNLERAMKLGGRVGGHLVSGHIDGLGKIVDKVVEGENWIFEISVAPELSKYIIKKGSVGVEGISLTVAEVERERFKICLIPHTIKETTLGMKNIGDLLNIEVDMIGKYVEKFLDKGEKKEISIDFLTEHGFA
ncbi:MAG: riboflavin synthase [bacterium]